MVERTMGLSSAREAEVRRLGPARFDSPLHDTRFVADTAKILSACELDSLGPWGSDLALAPAFELAGPRQRLFFDPQALTCGIVTCGGLCPAVNDVIRALVLTLHYTYRAPKIWGFRYGYAGLVPEPLAPPIELTPLAVGHIHNDGGTILGSSRGGQDLGLMADGLTARGIGVLFAIGGDGTLRGARALAQELERRKLPIAVIGIPKTIDNDLSWTERSFGFATAVEEARRVILGAHVEALGAWNGIGLVKLMGRHSGFIAARACLANNDANFCLVPEVPVALEGPGGLLEALARRLESRRHAVLVVAEGWGQALVATGKTDASGNAKLGDVGVYVRDRIAEFFAHRETPVSIKYIDPSYMIRSLPANASDSEFGLVLGQNAVHAAMAGRTEMVIAQWHDRFVHVPIDLAVGERKQIDPDGPLWRSVLQATGQPRWGLAPEQTP